MSNITLDLIRFLASEGKSDPEIADILGLSPKTIAAKRKRLGIKSGYDPKQRVNYRRQYRETIYSNKPYAAEPGIKKETDAQAEQFAAAMGGQRYDEMRLRSNGGGRLRIAQPSIGYGNSSLEASARVGR